MNRLKKDNQDRGDENDDTDSISKGKKYILDQSAEIEEEEEEGEDNIRTFMSKNTLIEIGKFSGRKDK